MNELHRSSSKEQMLFGEQSYSILRHEEAAAILMGTIRSLASVSTTVSHLCSWINDWENLYNV